MKKNLKEMILAESLELFNLRGYADVSMRDIAGACGIAVGNLTYYFHQKSDIAQALMEDPDYIQTGPVTDFHEFFFILIPEMLNALQAKRFFFFDEKIALSSDRFYRHMRETEQHILAYIFDCYQIMAESGKMHFADRIELLRISQITLMMHKNWNLRTYNCRPEDQISRSELILMQWQFLKKYVTDTAMDEYMSVFKELDSLNR